MGCVCAKARVPDEDSESPKEKNAPRTAVRRSSASAKVETADPVYVIDKDIKDRPKVRSNRQNGTISSQGNPDEAVDRRRERSSAHSEPHPRSTPKNLEGAQVAAGWPSWLSAVAGEAIKGWIPRHAASFEKLDKVSLSSCRAPQEYRCRIQVYLVT